MICINGKHLVDVIHIDVCSTPISGFLHLNLKIVFSKTSIYHFIKLMGMSATCENGTMYYMYIFVLGFARARVCVGGRQEEKKLTISCLSILCETSSRYTAKSK